MSRIVCVGEALIDFIAQTQSGDVGQSEFYRRAPGGAVSNVAVGVARLGGDAAFAGAFGRDPFGRFLIQTLAHENVNVDAARIVDAFTTLAFVARGAGGARDFVFVRSPGADSMLASNDLEPALFEHADVVHAGGVLLSCEPGASATIAALEQGAKAGSLVSFDPNARAMLFSSQDAMRSAIRDAAARAHIVKASADDLEAVGVEPKHATALLTGRTQAIVVTDGENEVRWLVGDAHGEHAPPKVKAVDTTGAGDAFMAALLVRLTAKHDGKIDARTIADAVTYASAAGAFACLTEGAIPSLPRARDVDAMLEQ